MSKTFWKWFIGRALSLDVSTRNPARDSACVPAPCLFPFHPRNLDFPKHRLLKLIKAHDQAFVDIQVTGWRNDFMKMKGQHQFSLNTKSTRLGWYEAWYALSNLLHYVSPMHATYTRLDSERCRSRHIRCKWRIISVLHLWINAIF